MRVFVTGLGHSGTTFTAQLISLVLQEELGEVTSPGHPQGTEWLPLWNLMEAQKLVSVEDLQALPEAPNVVKCPLMAGVGRLLPDIVEALKVDRVVVTRRRWESWRLSIRMQPALRHESEEKLQRMWSESNQELTQYMPREAIEVYYPDIVRDTTALDPLLALHPTRGDWGLWHSRLAHEYLTDRRAKQMRPSRGSR